MDADPNTLVVAAAAGDRDAWISLVDRYAGLVWATARAFRLNDADAADVSQVTWLRAVEHLDDLRNPAALSSWLVTTTRREALNLLRQRRTGALPDADAPEVADDEQPPPWHDILVDERNRELWTAFRRLSARCQTLLRLLVIDPAGSYTKVAAALDVPVGSLGPTRARCLTTLRGHLAQSGVDG
ncbi:RNA polymerase sigma factor [Polymorphospora lycopeni]|uniref:Sigma-70 family RNA polymerase sigma factor n=1 Tax=Polymorphospora lycopeni TaxID=3140240 RepID=A0ABV5D1U2_9ACTN